MFFKMAAALSYGSLASFGEKFSNNSDSLQDANTALAELDKGIVLIIVCFGTSGILISLKHEDALFK